MNKKLLIAVLLILVVLLSLLGWFYFRQQSLNLPGLSKPSQVNKPKAIGMQSTAPNSAKITFGSNTNSTFMTTVFNRLEVLTATQVAYPDTGEEVIMVGLLAKRAQLFRIFIWLIPG